MKSGFIPVLLLAAFSVHGALAQAPANIASPPASETGSRKKVEIVRTELEPQIDGRLDDEIWRKATVISDMHQFQPVDHAEPSERSEFYLAYNERFLFVGARMFDKDPAGIGARQLMQGGTLGFDDAFEFILDTFNNGRTGYSFQVNPNGIRAQGIYENPNTLNRDWNGIWQVESRIDEQGWTAEVAIPFNTLNFDPTSEEWGFTIARTIARKREEIAWSSFNRSINPSTTGVISGIRGIKQGIGLDIIPSIAVAADKNYIKNTSDNRIDPSVNVFYKLTPNLTGAITLNTDFSATEVDNRQVNLSRFSLFFPEKRDFFLQDVDIFTFGGRSGGGGGGGGGGNFNNTQNGIPFYSRRIGLSRTGQPVDINAGVKMTGRVGDWNVGALAVQQGEDGLLDKQQVFVGRASRNILAESTVGMIFTSGDPTTGISNSLAGLDFRYQNTRFSRRYTMRGDAFYEQTDTANLTGDDKAYGVNMSLDTQNNGVSGSVGYQYFGEDFKPGLGFANRLGVEILSMQGSARRFFVDNPILRVMNTFMRFEHARSLDTGRMQTENVFFVPMNLNTHRGDQMRIGFGRNREELDKNFVIRPGVTIPAGKYSWTDANIQVNLADQRQLSPSLQLASGEFYNGDRQRANFGVGWRPDSHLFVNFSYDYQDIQLPAGDFKVKLISGNINYAFNSKWSWVNLVQYDNASSTVGLNSRLRWNPRAGEDLFVVLNYNFDSEGVFSHMSAETAQIAVKYTKTFRY